MPKLIHTIAVAIILGLPAVAVTTGQPAQQPAPPPLPERLEQEKILENLYKPMSGKLLTEDQQKRLFAMGHELRLKIDKIHADKSMSEPQKTALLRPIIWEAKQKLADILAEINPIAPKPQAKPLAAPDNQNPGNPQWETVTTSDGKRIQINMAELARPEIVNIGALEIPEAYKRKKIIDAKGRAIIGQWIVIDRRIQSVKFRREDGKEFDIPFANLSEPDRRYAELETGITPNIGDPIDANEPNTASNWPFHFGSRPSRNWKTNAKDPKLGMKWPSLPGICKKLEELYTSEELLDHIRVRTLTTAFVDQYMEEEERAATLWLRYDWEKFVKQISERYNQELPRKRFVHIREMVDMLNGPEPEKETVSLKTAIEKSGVRLFEEEAKCNPITTVPLVMHLQGYHFIAQFMRVSDGKPKIPLSTLLEHTSYMGGSTEGISIRDYQWNGKPAGIEFAHEIKIWCPEFHIFGENFQRHLEQRLMRNHLRHNQPVLIDEKQNNKTGITGYHILTGFAKEPGKETVYKSVRVDGTNKGGSWLLPPYEVHEELTIKESEIWKVDWFMK